MVNYQSMNRSKKRFTLIELLVVIAIIAILAAMLLPALNKARASAKQIKCLSNMKNHSTGIAMYSDSHNDWLPLSTTNDGGNPSLWRYEIAPYIGTKATKEKDALLGQGVFSCPSWLVQVTMPSWLIGGYGWNMQYAGYREGAPSESMRRQKILTFRNPSNSILSGDTTDWYNSSVQQLATMYHPSCTWEMDPPVGNRHKKGINLTWADGHAEWMRQRDLRNGQNSDVNWFYRKDK